MVHIRPASAQTMIHCEVPVEIRDQMWAAAKAADLSLSQWVRRAIRGQLEREDSGHD